MDEIQIDDENEDHMKIMDSEPLTCKVVKQAEDSDEPNTSDNLPYQTDISEEVPKSIETIPSIPVASLDVHGGKVEASDQLIQASNEGGGDINAEIVDANPKIKLNLSCGEDQWSPFNKDGKIVYDRDFLLALRKAPNSNEKPENLMPNIMAIENREALNSVPITHRRGVGGWVNAIADKKRNRNVSNDCGWFTAPSRGSRTPFTVQSDKLKNKAPMMDEPLGSIQMFGNWGRGPQPPLTNTANMYDSLENIGTDSDKRPALGLRMYNEDTYSSKGPSFDRNYRQSFEGHGSVPSSVAPVPAPVESTPDQLECRLNNILEEYLNDVCSVQEINQIIKISISPSAFPQLVFGWYINVLARSETARLRTGYLFAQLIKLGTLSLQDYCVGLEAVLEEADELIIDIARVWDYVAELISPVLCESSATCGNLPKLFEPLVSKKHSSELLACLFKLVIQEKSQAGVVPVPSTSKAQFPISAPPVPAPVELTPDQLKRRLKNILEEYLNDCCSVQECDEDINSSIPPAALSQFVSDGYIIVLERSKQARLRTGHLFARLIKFGTLSLEDYCVGLEAVLVEADELIIDIPRVWDYVAELISPVLCQGSATFKNLRKSFEPLVSKNHASQLLACLFKLIIQEKGPNFLQSCWNSSGFTLADYMAESQVDNYVKENNFEFLLEAGDASPVSQSHSPLLGQSQLSYEEIHEKLLVFFKSGTSFHDIISWIAANVGERVKENPFIRTLATACFEDSIVNLKLKADILQGKYNLLHRFVDNKPAYELQCLYALQAVINKLEHPQGLLLAICDKLYEENVFSHESFLAWEASKDPAEQEGKGVALRQLTSFFTQLKADEDSSSSEDTA